MPGAVLCSVTPCPDSAGAATVAPDFAANTLATILGDTTGFSPGYTCSVEALQFIVGGTDFVGGGGTLTFELRRDSPTGTALASMTVALASAIRGHVFTAKVSAANSTAARLKDSDLLFLVRTATGTAFTTGEGTWSILARQRPQARI